MAAWLGLRPDGVVLGHHRRFCASGAGTVPRYHLAGEEGRDWVRWSFFCHFVEHRLGCKRSKQHRIALHCAYEWAGLGGTASCLKCTSSYAGWLTYLRRLQSSVPGLCESKCFFVLALLNIAFVSSAHQSSTLLGIIADFLVCVNRWAIVYIAQLHPLVAPQLNVGE